MKHTSRIASWGTRVAINFFTLMLTLLFFWFLGFVVRDIQTMSPPDHAKVTEAYHISVSGPGFSQKTEESHLLEQMIRDIRHSVSQKEQQQVILREGAEDIEKLLDRLYAAAIEDSEAEREFATTAWQQLLERRQQIITLSDEILEANAEREKLTSQKTVIDSELSVFSRRANEHYGELLRQHQLWVAFYLLAVLSPFFVVSVFLLIRCRQSPYFPIYLALGIATLVRIGFVIHDRFPLEISKYILIGSLIIAVLLLLVYAIRSVAKPTLNRILKQNRESYERFLCTHCEYPIRTGPRTFLYWTRRTVHKMLPKSDTIDEETYQCPFCGTSLYETCSACSKVRHAQLEFCRHCGDKKEI